MNQSDETKRCRHCQSEIPKKAKVVQKKTGKRKLIKKKAVKKITANLHPERKTIQIITGKLTQRAKTILETYLLPAMSLRHPYCGYRFCPQNNIYPIMNSSSLKKVIFIIK